MRGMLTWQCRAADVAMIGTAGAAAAGGAPGAVGHQRGGARAGAPSHPAAQGAGQVASCRAVPLPGARLFITCRDPSSFQQCQLDLKQHAEFGLCTHAQFSAILQAV